MLCCDMSLGEHTVTAAAVIRHPTKWADPMAHLHDPPGAPEALKATRSTPKFAITFNGRHWRYKAANIAETHYRAVAAILTAASPTP